MMIEEETEREQTEAGTEMELTEEESLGTETTENESLTTETTETEA